MKVFFLISFAVLVACCAAGPELSGTVVATDENGVNIDLQAVELKLIPENGFKLYSNVNRQSVDRILQEAAARFNECTQYLRQLSQTLADATLKIKQCENEYRTKGNVALDGFYNNMPGSAAVTVAEANGKFRLNTPKGKYVIAAKGRRHKGVRQMIETSENYYWLATVELKEGVNTIALDNTNLFDAD